MYEVKIQGTELNNRTFKFNFFKKVSVQSGPHIRTPYYLGGHSSFLSYSFIAQLLNLLNIDINRLVFDNELSVKSSYCFSFSLLIW